MAMGRPWTDWDRMDGVDSWVDDELWNIRGPGQPFRSDPFSLSAHLICVCNPIDTTYAPSSFRPSTMYVSRPADMPAPTRACL